MNQQNMKSTQDEALREAERRWESLTIADSFMFSKIMSNESLCTELLRRIFPELSISHVKTSEGEKTFETGRDSRGIRLDVYAEEEGRIFDMEMQMTNAPVLPKRSRYYQGTLDVTSLEKGLDYDQLHETFIIFICPFDLFGEGRHRYTFRNLCVESPWVELKDETTKVFLNAAGVMDDVSPELKAFLNLVLGVEAPEGEDLFIDEVEKELRKARSNRDWRREYMMSSLFERDAYLRGESKGLEEGERRGQQILRRTLQKLGKTEEEIEEIIREEYAGEKPLVLMEEAADFKSGNL